MEEGDSGGLGDTGTDYTLELEGDGLEVEVTDVMRAEVSLRYAGCLAGMTWYRGTMQLVFVQVA